MNGWVGDVLACGGCGTAYREGEPHRCPDARTRLAAGLRLLAEELEVTARAADAGVMVLRGPGLRRLAGRLRALAGEG